MKQFYVAMFTNSDDNDDDEDDDKDVLRMQ